MSLFDVETTAEALQEDEELIEAVENLVETVGESVKSEIMMEVNNARETVVDWLEWLFPLWVLYRDDHALFVEDIQKLALSLVLLMISFIVLTPLDKSRRGRRGRRGTALLETTRRSFRFLQGAAPPASRSTTTVLTAAPDTSLLSRRHSSIGLIQIKSHQSQPSLLALNNNNSISNSSQRGGGPTRRQSTSLLTGRVIVEDEEEKETDSERFAKNYQHLQMSRYRRLLLPPECKLVDKPKRSKPTPAKDNNKKNKNSKKSSSSKTSSKKKKQRRKKRDRDNNYEDHPAKRLQIYGQNLFFLIRSLLSYDYMGAGMALIRWLEAFLRIRHLRRKEANTPVTPEDDDDDDDESKASISVASTCVASTSTATQQQQSQPQHSSRNLNNNLRGGGRPQHVHVLAHQNSNPNSLTNISTSSAPQTPDRPEQATVGLDESFTGHSSLGGGIPSAAGEEKKEKESPLLVGISSASGTTSPPHMSLGGGSFAGGGVGEPPMTPVISSSSNLTMRRRTSETSLYSTPAAGGPEMVGESSDDNNHPLASLRLPLSMGGGTSSKNNLTPVGASGGTSATTTNLRPSLGGKKKDLLENYRSSATSSSILVPTNRNTQPHFSSSATTTNVSSSQSTTSTTSTSSSLTPTPTHSHSSSSGDATTVHRNASNAEGEEDTSILIDENDENDFPPINSSASASQQQQHQKSQQQQQSQEQQQSKPEEDNDEDFEDSSDPDDIPQGRTQRFDSDFSGFFFETANNQESLQQMSIEAPLPDKNGYIVGDEFLPDPNCTPLLVFVNSRSGPQQGQLLITQLRRLLNPIQVWDLGEDGGPETALESFCTFRNLRILVCGGDGTVSWIIAALEKMKLKRKWPPIGILPLGTGNDLARIHGWGGGYNNESLIGILEDVADSYISLLDQWELTIENRKGKVKQKKQFFNYLGVGSDAQAALQVHMLRESKPQLFFSRVVNKFWYGLFGAEDIIKATSLNLPNEITLIADGVEVPLPPDSQGIILLNIDSYSGGAPFWATGTKHGSRVNGFHHSSGGSPTLCGRQQFQPFHLRRTRSLEDLGARSSNMERIDSVEDLTSLLDDDQKFEQVTACDMPSSCQDGFLDIVSIRGAFHLGQVRVGLSNAQRLCQCREATIHLKRKVAVQIDGEPWRQNSCTLKVTRKPDRAIMLHKSEDKNGVETEVASLLDWAEKRQLINGDIHYAMMKEFSRRIEHKTRQRRNRRDQDNIMYSLKRAIGSTGAISSSYPINYGPPSYSGGNYEYHS